MPFQVARAFVTSILGLCVYGTACTNSRLPTDEASQGGAPAGEGSAAGAGAGDAGGTAGGAARAAGSGGAPASSGAGGEPSLSAAPGGTVIVMGEALCAGKACGPSEQCCLLTGECFDPSSPSSCEPPPTSDVEPPPPGTRHAPSGARLCASNTDCARDEYCENHALCLGVGYCVSRTNCPTSSGMAVCGCNGITYPNLQSACFAGTRIAGSGSCGETRLEGAGGSSAGTLVTTCARSSDCPGGQACCALTGRCYAAGREAICTEPPPGSDRACLDDSDCLDEDVCLGDGCEGLGGCVSRYAFECRGVLEPVCGCDGRSYTSAACAIAEGVRPRHPGQCAPEVP
jgi:hypothetical protein